MKGSHDSEWQDIFRPQAPAPTHVDEQPYGGVRDADDLGPCAARPMPGGWTGIYILGGKEDIPAFDYIHMGRKLFAGDRKSFFVEFNIRVGERWRVTVYGRNLWLIFVNIHHHKLEWIKTADRDFGDDNRPVITRIDVDQLPE